MELVRQRDDRDCGIAVVAIVAGVSYEDALSAFAAIGSDGIDTQTRHIRQALESFGITLGGRRIPMNGRKPEDLEHDAILAVNANAKGCDLRPASSSSFG